MNKKEMLEFIESQKGMPIKNKMFKHKDREEYKTILSIFEIGEYDEVDL